MCKLIFTSCKGKKYKTIEKFCKSYLQTDVVQ